ncbi:MAG: S8 family serine peptidase, partial [bacterium]
MGDKVTCVNPRSVNRFARWNGTSLATPIIAGICALLIQAHPHKPSKDIIEALRATATRSHAPNPVSGYGIPNAFDALQWLNSLKSD